MDNCPKCGLRLVLANGHIEFEGDQSPDTKTIAYQVQNKVCVNGKCELYCGGDLAEPKHIIDTDRVALN